MNVLDLFSGIGGFSLGLERAGFKTVAFCEIEEFPRKILKKHWPHVPIYEDIRKLTRKKLEQDGITDIGLICGGYPCQGESHAGKRQGKEDDRWLWPEVFRLLREFKEQGKPVPWFIGENVAGHVSMGLDTVLSDLESEGYATQTFIIPACAVDARHRRDRVWILATNTEHLRGAEQECQHQWAEVSERSGSNRLDAGAVVAHSQSCNDRESNASKGTRQKQKPGNCNRKNNVANTKCQGSQGRIKESRDHQEGRNQAKQNVQPGSSCGNMGTLWPTEPDVGRVVTGLSNGLDGGRLDGQTSGGGTGKILRALSKPDAAQKIRWPIRGLGSIQETEALLAELCKYQGKTKTLGNVSLESKETSEIILRGVWFNGETACSSCRRATRAQRTREHPDPVYLLSQILACDCESTWLDPTGTPSETSRTDRLKGLGNAVVPQIPEIIGRAIMSL